MYRKFCIFLFLIMWIPACSPSTPKPTGTDRLKIISSSLKIPSAAVDTEVYVMKDSETNQEYIIVIGYHSVAVTPSIKPSEKK